jgi:hypothetical protein
MGLDRPSAGPISVLSLIIALEKTDGLEAVCNTSCSALVNSCILMYKVQFIRKTSSHICYRSLLDQLPIFTRSTIPVHDIYSILYGPSQMHLLDQLDNLQTAPDLYSSNIHDFYPCPIVHGRVKVGHRSCRGWVKVEKRSGWSRWSGTHRKWKVE